MCVIVHQPKGSHIDKETCRTLWKTNPDGGGFAFINDEGQLDVTKSMEFNSFWSLFEQARSANVGKDFMLHMRIATHGSVKIENVHPFVVDEHTLMAHNGIIHGVPDYKDDDRTDTEVFIAEVLPQLPDGWLDNFYLSDMVTDWIGWSKLMFINVSPTLEHDIYRLGDWEEYKGLYLTNLVGLEKKVKKVESFPMGGKTKYYETSEGWNAWWEYAKEDASAWEADLFEWELKAERKSMLINHDIVEINGEWECYGCNKVIDTITAECDCWDAVCTECWEFLARCKIEGDCATAVHIDYENLDKEGQFAVSRRVGEQHKEQETEILAGVVVDLFTAQGEANTNDRRGFLSSL